MLKLGVPHISYGQAWNDIPFLWDWNGHSIPAGMEWSFLWEWNGVHSIPVGMEWVISFLWEWNEIHTIPTGMEWTPFHSHSKVTSSSTTSDCWLVGYMRLGASALWTKSGSLTTSSNYISRDVLAHSPWGVRMKLNGIHLPGCLFPCGSAIITHRKSSNLTQDLALGENILTYWLKY